MILGGLEILIGKAILGKVFAGAVAKTAVGVAGKALIVHDLANLASSLSDASDAATTVAAGYDGSSGTDFARDIQGNDMGNNGHGNLGNMNGHGNPGDLNGHGNRPGNIYGPY